MRPDKKSDYVLRYTRAIAKMIEYKVPIESREIKMSGTPEDLFPLVIGILGDICIQIINKNDISAEEDNIRFCAIFLDSYFNTERTKYMDNYFLLIGAAAYYICSLPGSSKVLIDKYNLSIEIQSSKLDVFLVWLLKDNYSTLPVIDDSIYKEDIISIMTELSTFYKTGEETETIIDKCNQLQNIIYEHNNTRNIFFYDLIYAIIIKKINNSCWINLPVYSKLPKDLWKTTITKSNFIHELWPSQILLGEEGVFLGQSAVIQMPTSAGKTKSTELIIRSSFMSGRSNVAIIIAPFKALCNEIETDLYYAFKGEEGIFVDQINDVLTTDDLEIFKEKNNKHIIILTPEKFYYLLIHNNNFTTQIGLVIFDEGHQFDSKVRGITYELLITELKSLLPEHCQYILISAVISNAIQISDWLCKDSKSISSKNTLPTERNIGIVNFEYKNGKISFRNNKSFNEEYFVPRVIEIKELPKFGREKKIRLFPDKENPQSIGFYLALKLSDTSTVAIYCAQKKSIPTILELICDYYKRDPSALLPKHDEDAVRRIAFQILKNLGIDNYLYKCSLFAIYAHHADLPHGLRMSIEDYLHKEKISFVICSTTLSQGINLPIKYMFITSTQQNEDKISVRDFHNLIGRVGRAGKLTEGSIIFTNPKINYENEYNYYWKETKKILNPENTEDCSSNLLDTIRLLSSLSTEIKESVYQLYFSQNGNVGEIYNKLFFQFPEINIDLKDLNQIYNSIEKIENFIMLLGDNFNKEKITEVATKTLAYNLGVEEEKKEILHFFEVIAKYVESNITDKNDIKLYAKTMRGINQSKIIKSYILDNIAEMTDITLLKQHIWNLFLMGFIENLNFNKLINKELLYQAFEKWVAGATCYEIYTILKQTKIGKYKVKIENIVNIFENGISYSGSIIVNAVMEIVKSFNNDDYSLLIQELEFLQKQIKYGLPTKKTIWIYEIGFCDRVIAQEIAMIINDAEDKYSIKHNLLMKYDEISNLLSRYPEYYQDILNKLRG